MAQHLRVMGIASVIGSAGDALMQWREGAATLDVERNARLVAFRTVHAPVVDACWRAMDRLVTVQGARGVLARIFLDQGFLMPPSLSLFFLSQGLLEGLDLKQACLRARDSFVPAASAAVPFWCVAHIVTFSICPAKWRMAWASVAAVGWNAIMSDQNQRAILREG